MTEFKVLFDEVINELKMYRTLEHGSYSYPFMYVMIYNSKTGKRESSFRTIQVTGWKFIYKILKQKKMNIEKIKKNNIQYPIIVYYDYMKSHLDYLKQLSLHPLPQDYDKFSAYYNNEQYSKWFPDKTMNLEQQFENIVKTIKKEHCKKYYKELLEYFSEKLHGKKIIRFSSYNLSEISNYLV